MNTRKGSLAIFLLVLVLVIVVGLGFYAYHEYRISYEQASASCSAGQFCSGSVTPASVQAGGKYVMACNYGYAGNGIETAPGSGACTYKGFAGNTALFDCVAGTTPGVFANSCKLDNQSPYPTRTDSVNALTVGCPPGHFCGGSVSRASIPAGGTYDMSCNYGYVGNGIQAAPGSGTCSYSGFSGDNAQFTCVAGNTAGTFSNGCDLDSASPYKVRSDSVGTLVVTKVGGGVSTSTAPVTSSTRSTLTSLIPSYATAVNNIQSIPNSSPGMNGWHWNWDPGTATTSIPTTGSSEVIANGVRQYDATFNHDGQGEIFKITWGNNTSVEHFVYDTYVELADPSKVLNLEMDMNQVLANGDTMIYGVQCAGGSNGTWMDTKIVNGVSHWYNSAIPCNPANFTPNTWYHIQIATHRDDSGDIFYDWVAVNGNVCYFGNGCVASSTGQSVEATNEERTLGWGVGTLLDNFQLDGSGPSGSMTAYTKDWTMWYW